MKIQQLKASDSLVSVMPYNKKRILLVDTERHSMEHYYGSFDLVKKCPNYTIDRDGTVYEHVPPIYTASYYKGSNAINFESVIVALNNCGGLVYDNNKKMYRNWANDYVVEENVFEFQWRKFTYWEFYPTKQLSALRNLCQKLSQEHQIHMDFPIGSSIWDDAALGFYGIISESNIYKTSTHINPSFDWKFVSQ